MKPNVSIIVPIYKVPEKFLRQCIKSLMKQTMRNIEIILVDDGSPDDCGLICDEYSKLDSRIKVIHKENAGLSAARNSGFFASTGEFITFVDGDDWLSPEACETAYKFALEKRVQLVFWDQITEYPNSSRIVLTDNKGSYLFEGKECRQLQARVLDFNGKIAQAFSKLINREYLVKYNIIHNEELKQGAEGIVFNIKLFEHLESAYYVSLPLYHYVYNSSSISHSHNEDNYYLIVKCFKEIWNFIQTSENKSSLTKNFNNRLLYFIITTGISGYFNPENKDKYKTKVSQYKKFLEQPILVEAMKNADKQGLSFIRKLILKSVDLKVFWTIALLGKIRRKQLMSK
jgi:glycosyltransferase EpsJ